MNHTPVSGYLPLESLSTRAGDNDGNARKIIKLKTKDTQRAKGRHTRVDMLQGHVAGTLSPRQIPSCEPSIFMKNLAAGTKFCPRDMSPEFRSVWIEGTCRGDKITLHPGYTQGRLVWTVHATCPRDPSEIKMNQSENEITMYVSATRPSVWTLQETYPRNMPLRVNSAWNSFPRHVPATCPLVCADLKERKHIRKGAWNLGVIVFLRARSNTSVLVPFYQDVDIFLVQRDDEINRTLAI